MLDINFGDVEHCSRAAWSDGQTRNRKGRQTRNEAPKESRQEREDGVESAVDDADDGGHGAARNLRHCLREEGEGHRNHFSFLEDR